MRAKSGPSVAGVLAVSMIRIVVGISFIAQPIKSSSLPPLRRWLNGSESAA
jgi:hypothetical protein